jgi:hypothetical protein
MAEIKRIITPTCRFAHIDLNLPIVDGLCAYCHEKEVQQTPFCTVCHIQRVNIGSRSELCTLCAYRRAKCEIKDCKTPVQMILEHQSLTITHRCGHCMTLCTVSGCNGPRMDSQHICAHHYELSMRCREEKCEKQRVNTQFWLCAEHNQERLARCSSWGCREPHLDNNTLCQQHYIESLLCTRPGCKTLRVNGTALCSTHEREDFEAKKCSVPDCKEPHMKNKPLCRTCYEKTIPRTVNTGCTHPDCKEPHMKGLTLCNEHDRQKFRCKNPECSNPVRTYWHLKTGLRLHYHYCRGCVRAGFQEPIRDSRERDARLEERETRRAEKEAAWRERLEQNRERRELEAQRRVRDAWRQ